MKYGFKTYKAKVGEHKFWVAESTQLKGCVAQGETLVEATELLEEFEDIWIAEAEESGIPIPELKTVDLNAGATTRSLRLPASTYEDACVAAAEEGMSFNQFATLAISEKTQIHSATQRMTQAMTKTYYSTSNLLQQPKRQYQGSFTTTSSYCQEEPSLIYKNH